MKAMLQCMSYCVTTRYRGLILNPRKQWNRTRDHVFDIKGFLDAVYATDPEKCKSVSGSTTTVDGVTIVIKSIMQTTIKLSATEAELDSAITCTQDMLLV